MNDSWPKPRSFSEEQPTGRQVLAFDPEYGAWCRIGLPHAKHNYTHWLPMPPDPPQPTDSWKESYANCMNSFHTFPDAFRAGWNAALEEALKQWIDPSHHGMSMQDFFKELKAK